MSGCVFFVRGLVGPDRQTDGGSDEGGGKHGRADGEGEGRARWEGTNESALGRRDERVGGGMIGRAARRAGGRKAGGSACQKLFRFFSEFRKKIGIIFGLREDPMQ